MYCYYWCQNDDGNTKYFLFNFNDEMVGDTLTVLNFTNDSLIQPVLFDVDIRAAIIECLRVWF